MLSRSRPASEMEIGECMWMSDARHVCPHDACPGEEAVCSRVLVLAV